MGNISAVGLVLLSFLVPLASPQVKSDRQLLTLIWLSLVYRHGLAFVNAFVTPLSTSWGDLYYFHNIGAGLADGTDQPYGMLLRVLYKVLGTSFWLGEVASVLVYSISLLLFLDLGRQLGAQRRIFSALLIYGFMPSPAIHTSVTFRESYQVLGLFGVVHGLLSLREGGASLWTWIEIAFSAVLLILMHQGLAPFVVAVAALGIPWALQSRGSVAGAAGLCFLVAVPLMLPLALRHLEDKSAVVQAFQDGRLLDYATTYRDHVNNARSDYGIKLDSSNIVSFAETGVAVLVMYFVAPLPWQASSVLDYYAFFEVAVRMTLLGVCAYRLVHDSGEQRQRLLFVVGVAMSLEMMWALGTSNWGTALRHHLVAAGLLVLVGSPDFSRLFSSPELSSLLARRERRRAAPLHA